jgi:ABC-type bacteriocin/lantibiotic exporter with double-glycine peptidase domain
MMIKTIKSIFGNVIFYTWKRKLKGDIVKALILKVLLVLFALLGPLFYSVLIQQVMIEKRLELLPVVFAGYAALFVFSWAAKIVLLKVSNKMNNKCSYFLKRMLLNKLYRLNSGEIKDSPGSLLEMVDGDVNTVTGLYNNTLAGILISLLGFAAAFIMALRLSPLLFLIILAATVLASIVDFILSKKLSYFNDKLRNVDGGIKSFIVHFLERWYDINNFQLHDYIEKKYEVNIYEHIKFMNKWAAIWETKNIYNDFKSMILQYVLIYFIGGIFVATGNMLIGALIVFAQYFNMMFNYLTAAVTDVVSLREKEVHVNKVLSILNLPEKNKGLLLPDEPVGITLTNVSFAYENKPVLFSNLQLDFPANTTTVIMGENGTGKSTLIKLITGRLPPLSGSILYNSHAIDTINDTFFRNLISCYSDNEYLFNISLRKNLLHEDTVHDTEQLWKLIDRLNLKYLIDSLPQGLDTIIEKNGMNFSGGERQRLLLIRALMLKSRILILDEPASALDLENEKIFMNYIKGLQGEKTIILITHKELYGNMGSFLINLSEKGRIK